jgi:hypothetical protein
MRSALLCAAAAVLTACGASQLPKVGNVTHDARAASWMESEVQSQDLLYVSDQGGSVYVFSYPGGKLVGVLTGFLAPAGLCSDSAGDVFVVDTPNAAVFEYRHGAKKPVGAVGAFGYPLGCAVDPATGDLAITTYQSIHPLGPGNVTVYTNTKKRKSVTFTDPSFNQFFFCGFDAKENLYVDGINYGTTQAEFAELRKGGTSLQDFTLDKRVAYPGGIQWDGSRVAVEDLSAGVLYQVKVGGSSGKVVGITHLNGDHSTLFAQFWIQNSTIVVPSGILARSLHRVGFWPYPSGGSPQKVLEPSGTVELLGATVSVASRR